MALLVWRSGKWLLDSDATYSDGFAEPIIWGVVNGYSIEDIAEGLSISVDLVIDVIESRTAISFPRVPEPVERDEHAARYDNWRRAVRGARATRRAGFTAGVGSAPP